MTGCSVRTTNGSPMKISAIVMPSGVNATLMPSARAAAQPAVRRIERGQRDAGHRRRQRERQIDQGVNDARPGKLVADEHPRHQRAEDAVHARGDERRAERRSGTTRPRADP